MIIRCFWTQLLSIIVVLGYFDAITKSWAQEDSSPPVIFLHPASFNASIIHGNESMELMCLAFGSNNLTNLTYSWERENFLLPKTASGQNSHRLTLSRLRPSDNGNYRCRVSNTHGSVFSKYATVNVTASMQAMVEPHNLTVEVTTSVILSCMVDGFQMDNVSYAWEVSETAGGMEASQLHDSTSSRLLLNNMTTSSAYRCIATNSSGKIAISPFSYITVVVHPPIITAHPTSKNVYLYTSNRSINISFTCATAGNSTQFQWERLQEALPVNSQGEATNTLTLYDVQPEDRGFYRCSVSNNSGTTHSNYATLNITVHLPNITAAYLNQSVYNVGDRAVFVCNGEGYGKLSFEWERQNGNVSLSGVVDMNSGTLVIPNLSSVDRGNYRCIVHDEFNGTVYSEYVQLNLPEGPVISTASSEAMFVRQNTNASLSCGDGVDRLVNATFMWSRTDGKPLSNRTYGSNSSVLIIIGVTEEDEVEYSCTATTKRETLTRAILLTVYDIPRISQLPSQHVVELSGSLFITCTAQNDRDSPHPLELAWYKGDNQLMDGQNERYQISSEPERDNIAIVTLEISHVQKDDAGQYSCQVNPGDISTETTVVVNYKPEILTFQILPSNTVAFGEGVQLLCRVDGKPLPTVTIYRNNEMRFSTINTVVEYPIQQVSANHDGTVFSCGARNRVGAASQQHITLTVTGIPETSSTTTISPSLSTSVSMLPTVTATSVFAAPTSRPVAAPTNIEQTSRELDSLQIQWTASDGNVLFHIRLSCVTPCTDGEEVRNFETRDTSLIVHGLKPGHTYAVEIATVTDNDVRSEYSDPLQVSTASASDPNSVMFQLRLVSETACNEWEAKLDLVTATVVNDIAEHCGCPLSSANVFDDGISCDNAGHVIYRAGVTTSAQLNAEELSSVLDEWFTQTSMLTVDGSILQVDRSCPLILTSFDDPICRTTTSPDSSNSEQNVVPLLAGIIGGIIIGAVIVTILAVILVVKCRGKTDKIRPGGNTPVNSSLTRSGGRAQTRSAGRKAQTNEEATYSEVFNNLPPLCELQSCPAYQASVYLDHDYADIDEHNFTAVTSAQAGQVHPSHSHNELEVSSSSSSVRCNGNDYCEPLTLDQRMDSKESQLVQAKAASNGCSDYIEPVSHNSSSNSELNHQDTTKSQPLQQQQHQQLLQPPTEYLEPVSHKDSHDHFQKYDHLSSTNKLTNIYTECN